VDTFSVSFEGSSTLGRDPSSEGDVLPEYQPSDDPIQQPAGIAKIQIFTIFIETFIEPDPNLAEVSALTGGAVLTAANAEEVVARLLEVITSTNAPPVAKNDAFSVREDQVLKGNVLVDNGSGADTDPDGDALTVSLVTGPAEGKLTLNTDGTFSYDADSAVFDLARPGEVIKQSFTYKSMTAKAERIRPRQDISVTIVRESCPNRPDRCIGQLCRS
jgi:VCBS repeat-containing protein